ncbi:unnamed protein product [Bursaphelenchus xylophilus]|uniref:(pine wood nematode) hypothetical protein n=1 Tax=Bursaphelenchus xylophilus TaxID=6326 RepID=A0A7I8XES1_BURXY|nr:unnamed protein product [Bursaphelenchus xylophilus]CAG9113674.1 unnamed protein product [Bursaphelenchus xylophilus]
MLNPTGRKQPVKAWPFVSIFRDRQEPYKSFTGGRNNEIEQGNGQVVVANGGNKLLPGIPVSLSSAVFLLKTVPISILDTCNMRKVIWRS